MALCRQILTLGRAAAAPYTLHPLLVAHTFMLFVAFGIAPPSKQLGDSEMKRDTKNGGVLSRAYQE